MDDKVPNQIWIAPVAFRGHAAVALLYGPDDHEDGDIQFTRTDHVISTIRELGERFTLTKNLVDAICDEITKDQNSA